MHFLPIEEARAALSTQKSNLEKERQDWLNHQSPSFQRLQKANQSAVNKQWNVTFIVLLVLIAFVINTIISLGLFFILEHTVYTEAVHIPTQGDRAIRALFSTLIFPVLALVYALIHNIHWKEKTPNQTRLTLIRHPDYAVWAEHDEYLHSHIHEINNTLHDLSHRGLLYIDGEAPADRTAVLGTLYINGERITDLTYNEMPYEFHMDEGTCHVSLQSGTRVLFEQTIHLRHVYVATLDLTGDPAHPAVEMQNMMKKAYKAERAKMSRKGTVYVAHDRITTE